MEEEHTPGPWKVGEQNGHCGLSIVNGATDLRVATVYFGLVTSEAKWGDEHKALPENAESVANAHLIAAAPELLEACEAILKATDPQVVHNVGAGSARDLALAAIAKARGETQ